MLPEACNSIEVLRSFLGRETSNREGCDLWSSFVSKSESLSLIDVNYVLYRCDVEERDDGKGGGVYDVPHVGRMTYCGLQVRGRGRGGAGGGEKCIICTCISSFTSTGYHQYDKADQGLQ